MKFTFKITCKPLNENPIDVLAVYCDQILLGLINHGLSEQNNWLLLI